jgi:hypothetical protein
MAEKQSQQDFLREAMQTLDLTRDGFSARFTVPRRTLDKWLLPDDSKDHRPLPDMAKAYIREVLALHQT